MKEQTTKIIKRLLTAVLYWLLFVGYAYYNQIVVDYIDVLVLFGMSGVFAPYVVGLITSLYSE